MVVHSLKDDIEYINGSYADLNMEIRPAISDLQLYDYVLQAIKSTKNIDSKSELQIDINLKEKELLICKDFFQHIDIYTIAYKVYVSCNNPLINSNLYIDAINGKLLSEESLVCASNASASAETMYSGTKGIITGSYNGQYRLRETRNGVSIETYNMNHGLEYNLPGVATDIIDNNTTWTIAEHPIEKYAHDTHWATEKVFDYWLQVHNRNSWDGNGGAIKSYIEYGDYQLGGFFFKYPYPCVAYGRGNGSCYKEGSSLDNVAHELGHGICYYTSDLYYGGDPGAINESFSDIWGAVIENWAAPSSPPKQKWKIGEEFTLASPGYIRDMANPSSTNDNPSCGFHKQPDTYNGPGYIPGANVHKNSGIMNYWFYLLTEGSGGNQTNDVGNIFNVTGIGITKSAKIAYETEKAPLSLYANFFEARAVSIWKARKLYGGGCKGSAEEIAVTKAWYAVNVGPDYNSNPPYTLDGDGSACNQYQCNTYSLSGLPMIGNNLDPDLTINWTLTQTPNNTVAGVNNGNGTYTICRNNNNNNGLVTLTAQIIFGTCTTTLTKSINAGLPYVLWNPNGCTYPEATYETGQDEGPCNSQCYSPSQSKWWCATPVYNATNVTWQKMYSIPTNYSFWSGSWSGNNNYVNILFKSPNQYVELKTTISNPCGSIVQYYCFNSTNILCSGNLKSSECQLFSASLNPANKQLQIRKNNNSNCSSESADLQIKTIQIVDKVGNIIKEQKLNNDRSEFFDFNLSSLKNDVYLILIQYNDSVETHQIAIFR